MSNVYVEPDMQTSKLGDDVTTAADDIAKVHDIKLGRDDVKYQRLDSDGYMEPNVCKTELQGANVKPTSQPATANAYSNITTDSLQQPLMTESQLSDTYLTVTPLTSPSREQAPADEVALVVANSDVTPPVYANNRLASRQLPKIPDEDYLPMK